MPISIEADPSLAQGYIKVNGTTAATLTASGIVSGGVPAGAILPFAMNSAPAGWLAADGTTVSRTDYAALFTAIGTTYGVGDGSTTFDLPDLRGYFVRGSGTNGDGTAAGTFGGKQADLIKNHTHAIRPVSGAPDGGPSAVATSTNTTNPFIAAQFISTSVNPIGLGAETRPKNIALLYCIKF
jgi:microcystin-dependent protein